MSFFTSDQFAAVHKNNLTNLAKLSNTTFEGIQKLTELNLHLPKFKLQPPLMRLSKELMVLGLKRCFDVPRGSADFDRLAPRRPDDYLRVSEVFHKTFLDLDEKGTEAAAATETAAVSEAATVSEAAAVSEATAEAAAFISTETVALVTAATTAVTLTPSIETHAIPNSLSAP